MSSERIAQPFNAHIIDQDTVEAARCVSVTRMLAKPVPGCDDDLRLLGVRNAGGGAAKIGTAAHAYFNKDNGAAVATDEVNLATAHTEVSLHDLQAVRLQVLQRSLLAGGTGGLCGSHRTGTMVIMTESANALYVVATPIGNLGDITLRALETLRGADLLACEDTRHAQALLDHHGIRVPTLPVHEHNEAGAATRLVDALRAGKSVALITDAGTPGISDPGARACAAVREAGFRVVPLPGPNAAATAMSAAGLPDARFLFVGFLPAKSAARRREIEALKSTAAALVFYEAPHRVVETVADLAEVLEPQRTLVIARELTKLFEQIAVMPLPEGNAWLAADSNHQRGEFVLIVSGPPPSTGLDADTERTLRALLAELPVKQAAKLAAEITGAPKNALYQRALELKA